MPKEGDATVPQMVLDLVGRFARNSEAYKSASYNEAQVRREFIDPLFKCLGWDIENEQGYAEAYKDVVHEDAIKVGEATKAPDYCFRVGGARKFFLEAKKPAIDIQHDAAPAFQLRRYAWTAKLPLGILTDFQEFAVYDCRVKPDQKDKASVARILYLPYTEYAARWGEIANVFSRDAVLKGSFDKYAEGNKAKRGTAAVDDAFLETIESWRKEIAENLALRNRDLSPRELNFAVQRTIDRIIFLRICEGRGLEDYGKLQKLATEDQIYARLGRLFREADDRYNSGLFHFQTEKARREPPDELTLGLDMDDNLLRGILRSLYYPESPYVFSALPADVLGQVYEQFLGKVVRLTEGHRAKVEDKPEVKKAGGVYYTPTYIVEYIVENTVGKLLEDKTPRRASNLRILDPACGSGSFLLGAYERLLQWHLKYYSENNPAKWAKGASPALVQASGGGWKLTVAERKRILLANIYGVDIDAQAVETTKLALLLKVLEGETQQSLQPVLSTFQERALPDLGDNIKCGNSLIGPDFYQQQLLPLGEEERYRVNVFDWNKEFSQIMKAGGFDVVMGNPPYVLVQAEFRDDKQLDYFRSKFRSASFKIDTYHLFIEQGINLTKKCGRFSMITPANFLTNNRLDKLRRLILRNASIQTIVVIDSGVFRGISVDNAISIFCGGRPTSKHFRVAHARSDGHHLVQTSHRKVSPAQALRDKHILFTGTSEARFAQLWKKTKQTAKDLGALGDVNFGKQLRDRKVFLRDVIKVPSAKAIPRTHVPCYTGRDVSRYSLAWGHLACLKSEIARSGGCWDASKHNAKNKLLTRQIGRFPDFALDRMGWDCLNSLFMINLREGAPDPQYVLGVLNSRLMRSLWLDRFYDQRRTFPKIKGAYLKLLPIATVDFSRRADKSRHDQIVGLVEQIMDLHNRLEGAKSPPERTSLERQVAATDAHIDRLVYDLYGLTADEIKLVEEVASTK